ncbi:MAG: ubiquinol-cytochrome c reductase iron-sulfur subunit [Bryobacteraceae bacterium]
MQEEDPRRRDFYLKCIYGLGGLMSGALDVPAAVYLLSPPKTQRENAWVQATDVAQLPDKTPQEVSYQEKRIDGWKVTTEKATAWVVKMSNTDVVAFSPQCTHLGCAYHWEADKNYFLCPCHTSTFAIDGRVLSGPAPRPLDRYEVKLEGTKLLLGPIQKA